MASTDRIFVSPGVFTSEKDLTFVTRQVGVTTLGLLGETPKGPAFEPVFISNYDEFISYFGGLNSEKFKGNGFQKYELNYIAKSFLTQTNQLYVSRVLGLSGYKAGSAWAITMDAALDDDTVVETVSATTYGTLVEINAFGNEPKIIKVPGHFWHGTKNIGTEISETTYFLTNLYDYNNPDEERITWDDKSIIDPRTKKPYDWMAIKD